MLACLGFAAAAWWRSPLRASDLRLVAVAMRALAELARPRPILPLAQPEVSA
jgi:hypothetical protein